MPAPSAPSSVAIAAKSLVGYAPNSTKLTHRGAVKITWALVPGVSHRVEKQANGGAWTFGDTVPDGYDFALIGELVRASTYKFRVRAENGDGVSAWVESATWTVPAIPTTASAISLPTGLSAGSIGPRRATLTWTDTADNDSGFVIRLIPTGKAATYIYVAALEASCTLFNLQPATSYGVAIAPVGGRYKGLSQNLGFFGGYPLLGDFSADVQFSTLADAITIAPPPAQNAYIGRSVQLRVNFSATATSASIADQPTGITGTPDGSNLFIVIAGTPAGTNAPGLFNVEVTAANGTGTDTIAFPLTLWRPVLVPAWGGAPITAYLGEAMSAVNVSAGFVPNHTPPAASPVEYSATGLPSWASISASGEITGTPDASGTWIAQVTASNGIESVEAPLTLVVPGLQIASASTRTAYVGQPFTHPLQSLPAGASFTTDDELPDGVILTGSTLAGTATSAGVYSFDLVGSLGESASDSQTFTLTVKPLFTLSETVEAFVGEPVSHPITFEGRGTMNTWQINGAPSGLAVQVDSATCAKGFAVKITGTPTEGSEGFYDTTVSVQVTDVDGVVRMYRQEVTITVSGGLLLGWLHADPENRDLQIFPRSHEVKSFYATAEATWWLKRGDTARVHVVWRDGKYALLDVDDYSELRLYVRETDQYDAEPILSLGGSIGTDVVKVTVSGREAILLEFEVDGSAIEERFERLNEAHSPDSTTRQLKLIGEFEYVKDGVVRSTSTFPVVIDQDVAR